MILGDLPWTPSPAHPPGALGAATYHAADLVDRAAFQLLASCAPYDPPAENLARLEALLASWPAIDAAVRQLAAHVQAETIPAPANDAVQVRAIA